ncbi:MAG: hypothetical protein J07HQX50_01820 [Haloquadratum sp. J07HQX50]|nr:MAG: hypothetical protein J07HQX50_01820 [Haloquadratum sp. J07HQX50]
MVSESWSDLSRSRCSDSSTDEDPLREGRCFSHLHRVQPRQQPRLHWVWSSVQQVCDTSSPTPNHPGNSPAESGIFVRRVSIPAQKQQALSSPSEARARSLSSLRPPFQQQYRLSSKRKRNQRDDCFRRSR